MYWSIWPLKISLCDTDNSVANAMNIGSVGSGIARTLDSRWSNECHLPACTQHQGTWRSSWYWWRICQPDCSQSSQTRSPRVWHSCPWTCPSLEWASGIHVRERPLLCLLYQLFLFLRDHDRVLETIAHPEWKSLLIVWLSCWLFQNNVEITYNPRRFKYRSDIVDIDYCRFLLIDINK
jgi:hypothetical protein